MSKSRKDGFAAPTALKPYGKKDRSILRVVVETPKGCRNKYKYDPKLGAFELSKVLPDGMNFPYDFGFVPSTLGEDGDPIDVLLLMDESAFPGCVVESRLIGVIEGEQEEDGEKERNDRLVAIASKSYTHSDLKDLTHLNQALVKELGRFFVNYHQQQGARFKVVGVKGPKDANRLLEKAIKRAKNS